MSVNKKVVIILIAVGCKRRTRLVDGGRLWGAAANQGWIYQIVPGLLLFSAQPGHICVGSFKQAMNV